MNYTTILRSKGIKVTPQRISVYKALMELGHASVEEIAALVAIENPTITTATVYNVLSCFAEHGIISRLSTPMGRMHYDISTHKHHHIISKDGKIVDYESEELSDIIEDYLKKHPLPNYNIEKVSLQLLGSPL